MITGTGGSHAYGFDPLDICCKIKHKKNAPDGLERFGKDLGNLLLREAGFPEFIDQSQHDFPALGKHALVDSHGVRHLGMDASSPKMRIEKRKSARASVSSCLDGGKKTKKLT